MTSPISAPLHIATINGRPLRFFRSPNNDGRPDLPWHSTDDLQAILGLTPEGRRIFATMCRSGPFKNGFETVATEDGLVMIAPHYVAQGTINALATLVGPTEEIFDAYCDESVEACRKLTGDMHGAALLTWLVAARNRHDDAAIKGDA